MRKPLTEVTDPQLLEAQEIRELPRNLFKRYIVKLLYKLRILN